jgi:hypothetical protein
MKIVARIVQVLLGLVFFVFGLNGFFNFLHGALPGGPAGDFLGIMIHSHYVWLVAGTQVLAGFLLLINRFVPLALVFSGALIANILMFHLTMARGDIGFAIVIAIFWVVLMAHYRRFLAPVFIARTDVPVRDKIAA